MKLIPAILVAVLTGVLGAFLTLVSGHGWGTALVVYWLSGNLGLMAMLVPTLLHMPAANHGDKLSGAPRLSAWPVLWATCWIMLGIAMIFWQAFDGSVEPSPTRGGELGTMVGLGHEPDGAAYHYQIANQLPDQLRFIADLLLRLPVWLLGLLVYLLGVTRLLSAAANRLQVSERA